MASCCVARLLLFSCLLYSARAVIDGDGTTTYAQLQDVERPDPVHVKVYFESLCGDSMRFFRRQLGPVYAQLDDIIQLEFIPFGKAVARPSLRDGRVNIKFECQHGPWECLGNRIMSCAQNFLNIQDQHKLFMCMMTARNPPRAGKQCCEKLDIDYEPLEQCTDGRLGAVLLYMNGRKTATLRPRLYYVPTVTINGNYSRSKLFGYTTSLKQSVCEAYKGSHPNC